jgi:cytoskeletal protein CcmA (bactofilin family)
MSKSIAAAMTFISDGSEIVGDIKVEHDLRVEGYLKGTVVVGGMLVLGPTGKIEGEVTARSATIAGQIIGNIKGQEKIVLETKSTLVGDLQTCDLVINEGAVFQGNCSMRNDERK